MKVGAELLRIAEVVLATAELQRFSPGRGLYT